MGLNERRKMKELEEVTFPGRVKEIEEICGAPIPYDVDWSTLAEDAEALRYIDNISCHRVNMALRVICMDEMGKAAVRDGLKKIKLSNVRDRSAMKIEFQNGVLEMSCNYAAGTNGMFNDGEIRQALEKGL